MTTTGRAQEIIAAIRRSHTAVLGKTGSGKTSTEKLMVESAVAENFRVCVLDTIKSDWWGITSSSTGKSPGLPFKILGGPRGHVPLHSSAGKVIGQLVGTGKLPLSIIDMADFEPGGIQRFFVDFAEALWKNVRGVVVLVIEEAHEIAPKEMAGFGKESMSIYWAKKLATGSRTKGIRLIVGTQRTQALHNAVLGSAETLIAHRMTLEADQAEVRKWLKNTNKMVVDEVASSLGSLPDGTSWVCSGEAQIFERVHWPKFKTYDNTATPESDGPDVHVKTAAVNQDELRAIIGDAVKLAEDNDVPTLQKKIVRLEAHVRNLEAAPAVVHDPGAEERGFERGKAATINEAKRIGTDTIVSALADMRKMVINTMTGIDAAVTPLKDAIDAGLKTAKIAFPDVSKDVKFEPMSPTQLFRAQGLTVPAAPIRVHRQPVLPKPSGPDVPMLDGEIIAIPGPEQKIIDSIRWWNCAAVTHPSPAQVAFLAGYSHKSGTWDRYLSGARKIGVVEKKLPLVLTAAGLNAAKDPEIELTRERLWTAVLEKIDGPSAKIMKPVIAIYPDGMTPDQAAEAAGYSAKTGTWDRYVSGLRKLELIERTPGVIKAQGWLFP